jgi:hypothetical protein
MDHEDDHAHVTDWLVAHHEVAGRASFGFTSAKGEKRAK